MKPLLFTLICFIFWIITISSAQQISEWSTNSHDLLRQSYSKSYGPVDTVDVQTTPKWFFTASQTISPLFIVGNSLGFRILSENSFDNHYPEGKQLEAFSLTTGDFIWQSPEIPDDLQIYAAFPPEIDPNGLSAAACILTYQPTSVIFIPYLQCYFPNGSVIFNIKCPELVKDLPEISGLFIGMEFFTQDLLLLTNRGTTEISNYVLLDITDREQVWSVNGIFDTVDDLSNVKPFTPTILDGNYLYMTNTTGPNYSVTSFSYELMSGQSVPLWSYTFSGNLSNIGHPMYCNFSEDGMIIVSYSITSGPYYLVGLDPLTGELLWSYQFIEPIMGYACPEEDYIFVTSVTHIYAFRITSRHAIEPLWNDYLSLPGPFSPPTVDKNLNVYVCVLGRVVGYDLDGNQISHVQNNPSLDYPCDQPILYQSSILVRTNILSPTQGVLLADLVSTKPTPQPNPTEPDSATEIGMIVGISVGALFFLVAVLILIFVYKRRRAGGYSYEVLY